MTRRSFFFRLCLVCLVLLVPQHALSEWWPTPCSVVPEAASPIVISRCAVEYLPPGDVPRERVTYAAAYANSGVKKVVAVEIAFLSFDVWNQFMGADLFLQRDTLISDGRRQDSWGKVVERWDGLFATYAYVARVRYEDGQMWSANREAIVAEVQKQYKGFTAAVLQRNERRAPQ